MDDRIDCRPCNEDELTEQVTEESFFNDLLTECVSEGHVIEFAHEYFTFHDEQLENLLSHWRRTSEYNEDNQE